MPIAAGVTSLAAFPHSLLVHDPPSAGLALWQPRFPGRLPAMMMIAGRIRKPPPPPPKMITLTFCRVEEAIDEAVLDDEEEEVVSVGARVRVKVPLKVFHVAKLPDLDLDGMEGEVKENVSQWKGKRVSANLPFKVQFHFHVDGGGRVVKFFAHLKEDEFDCIRSD